MALTNAQLIQLRDGIAGDPELSQLPQNSDGAFAIAAAFNVAATPAFTVWRTAVPTDEIMSNGFAWAEIDTLTAGQARIWSLMSQLGTINPSKANVRQGLRDAFPVSTAPLTRGDFAAGTGGIQPHLRRVTTRGERLFATGTGTIAAPGQLQFEGLLTFQDVEMARAFNG